jgi:hypothetical protein
VRESMEQVSNLPNILKNENFVVEELMEAVNNNFNLRRKMFGNDEQTGMNISSDNQVYN